jgi:hypothetical protein
MSDTRVPCADNLAERDRRMVKPPQKMGEFPPLGEAEALARERGI